MAKQKPYDGPGRLGMSDSDASKAFKQLGKIVKGFSGDFLDLAKRYSANRRPKYFAKIIQFFSNSSLKVPQFNNYEFDKALATEEAVKPFVTSQAFQFFTRENGKLITNLKNALKNFKVANPLWKTNAYLKLKVEFITEAIALYVADLLCHKSDELFVKYEKAFATVAIPHGTK